MTPLDRDFARYRAALAGATLVMVGLSWPLWVGGSDWPQIPFVAGWPLVGRPLAWTLGAFLVGALAALVVGRGGRWVWALGVATLVILILGDQNRLQPWVQQFGVVGLAVVCLPQGRALDLARWYVVVLDAASGMSKLDAAFGDELGATFLMTLGHLIGLTPERWPGAAQTTATLVMPVAELAIAVLLAVPRTRLWGLAGSAIQHLATIAILGPWALDHSTIVLVWNGAILVENWVLFGPGRGDRRAQPAAGLAAGLIVVALVGLERWGWVDSWPAHALYASHAERSSLRWPEAEAAALPISIRRWLGPADADGDCRLDLTGWSRAGRGVPVYPQNRVACGIAEALVERYGDPAGPPVRVTCWGRAGWTRHPSRTRTECVGLAALRRRAARFVINATPAPGFGR